MCIACCCGALLSCARVILIPPICIDNVEVIIIAMACHIGPYLELTFNEGSQLRYHLKRGDSAQLGSAKASSQAASTSFPLSANSQSVQRPDYKLYYTSISLSWALTAYINCAQYSCYALVGWSPKQRGVVNWEVSRDWRFQPPIPSSSIAWKSACLCEDWDTYPSYEYILEPHSFKSRTQSGHGQVRDWHPSQRQAAL